ncbi:AlbA family DNA-binding domain-containing protein [Kitasatospora griseola]|uniref:AlbA family DNA-binding domain-containing protein n=1 Tax=Kitasatospora griseola TaxID=2064 RepID=UPI00366430F5
MAARFHRIEALFGGRLDQITFTQLAGLVGNTDAFEDEDLDYKSIHYAPDKKAELAKDVAAMANTIGGVLVLGLAEDRKSRCPSAVVPVELTDGRLRQIRATVASNLRPAPRIELIAKEDSPGSNQGILLIAVPRSPDAPHAVIEHNQDHRLAYPYRDGDTTRWLTEAQVATSYRRRFQELTERGDRLTRVDNDIEDTTDDLARSFHRVGGHALLTVSLVPDVPGDMVVDNRTIRTVTEQELRAAPLIGRTSAPFTQTRVGHRRIILLDHGQPPDFVAELHGDGSGAWAVSVPTWPLTTNEANPWGHGADTDAIVALVLSALCHLAHHAVTRTGASGTTALRARLISRTRTDSPILLPATPRWQALHLAHQRLSGHQSGIQVGTTAHRIAIGQAHTLLDDLADEGPPLLQAASLLIGDLFQHYGIAEAPQLTRGGTLNAAAWAEPERTRITTWARQAAITVT